jgi:hypothetical protein
LLAKVSATPLNEAYPCLTSIFWLFLEKKNRGTGA